MRALFIVLIILVVQTILMAQAPTNFTYQGVVRDENSMLVTNKNIGVQISVLQGSAVGTEVYKERHFIESNENGLITLLVGQGTVISGVIASINWNAGPLYMKSEIDLNGGANYTISGVSMVSSVPYALYAKNVENLPPLKIGELSDVNTSNVGVGQVLKWNGTEWVPGNDIIGGGSGPTYTGGSGINIDGNNVITNTGDNDNSLTNELQTLSLNGDQLSLSNNGGMVTLPTQNNITYLSGQGITFTGNTANSNIVIHADMTGSGTTNSVPLWTSSNYVGNSIIRQQSGSLIVDGGSFFRNPTTNEGIELITGATYPSILATKRLIINAANDHIALNPNGNSVGVGTLNPSDKLHVVGDAIRLSNNGSKYLRLRTDGNALDVSGYGADLHFNSNGNDIVINQNNGNVGIGTDVPTAKLSVNGTANKPGGGSWATFSDRRLKKNIIGYNQGLEQLKKLNIVSYEYNDLTDFDTDVRHVGIIAQELSEIAPEMVSKSFNERKSSESEIYLMVDPSDFTYMSINAINELSKQVELLKEEIEILKKKLNK